MGMPKSVVKFKKDGFEYVESVDRVNYTIKELARAALRDVGKFICRTFRQKYYAKFRRRKGRVGKYTQYWVRTQGEVYLEVGLKPNAFYGGFQELGTKDYLKDGFLTAAVQENIDKIVEIESKYLSGLEDEAKALALIKGGGNYEDEAD